MTAVLKLPSWTAPEDDTRWMLRAVCSEDPDAMFSEDDLGVARAKRVCALCPVRDRCLRRALALPDKGDLFGIYGGLTAPERKALRKQRHSEVAA